MVQYIKITIYISRAELLLIKRTIIISCAIHTFIFTCKCLLSTTEKHVKHKTKLLCKTYCDLKKVNTALEVLHVQSQSFVNTNSIEEKYLHTTKHVPELFRAWLDCLIYLSKFPSYSFLPNASELALEFFSGYEFEPQLDHQLIRVFSDRTTF